MHLLSEEIDFYNSAAGGDWYAAPELQQVIPMPFARWGKFRCRFKMFLPILDRW